MAQFRREAERGIRLAGPALLTIYELSSIDGYYFMAMPYVEGITLREVVRVPVRPPARRAEHGESITS